MIDSRRLLAALVGLVAQDVFGADLRLGAAIASDYVFRGVVQTDQGIAYQAVAEIESAHGFYGGVWRAVSTIHSTNATQRSTGSRVG